MSFFGKRPKSAQQKAQRAQFRALAQVLCCIYLIFYVIIPMVESLPDDDGVSPTLKMILIVVFSIATVLLMFLTVRDFIVNIKTGKYKAEAYTSDPIEAELELEESEPESEGDVDDDDDEEN